MKIKNPKFNVFIFYGTFAVGKYTVAKEFHKKTGYKFFHNHHTYNIARELFERGTLSIDRLCENLRLDIFKEIAKAKINTVSTHAYSSDFISKTGLSDIDYVKKVESIIEKEGGICYFIHLKADSKIILKRLVNSGRAKMNKLTNPDIMKKVLKERDFLTSAPVKYNIEIDNTNLTPKQVVKKLLDMNLI